MEIDVVAESLDRKHLLVGEAEWSAKPDLARQTQELRNQASQLPSVRGRTLHFSLRVRRVPPLRRAAGASVFGPDETLQAT